MELVQYEPFSLMGDLDRFFDFGRRQQSGWLPRIDLFDREDDLVIRVEIPGVDLDDIEVTIEDRALTITGSRALDDATEENGYHRREILAGEFKRTIVLPEGMNAEEITANADSGMLEVVVPRRPEILPRKVTVDVTG